MSKKLKLNDDQTRLIYTLNKFYNSDQKYFLLSGQAGVGKTTCMRYFSNMLFNTSNYTIKICMGGPTNKSTAVLSRSVDDSKISFKTIHSLLGLRMMPNGEYKELKDMGKDKIGDYDLVIVDEASMISTELLEYIFMKTKLADTKVIFIGDKQQLPPVNEKVSPIWTNFDIDYELTEVMRHQNSILDFVQHIRGNKEPEFVSTGDQVFMYDDERFFEIVAEHAKRGVFHNGECKAIAWRNDTVDKLNTIIRLNYEPTNVPTQPYVAGDRIVFKEPVIEGDVTLATTDEEGGVENVTLANHNKYANLKAWKISIRLDYSGKQIYVYVVHKSSESMLQGMLDEMKDKKMWGSFWTLKEAFHNISHAYALTAHRSQGSTFKKAFVDAGDIQDNPRLMERVKCLYVACSRASDELHVFI